MDYPDLKIKMLEELIDSIVDVTEFFIDANGECPKAKLWWRTPNPLLGQLSPIDMLMLGRERKLINFIQQQLSQNEFNPQPT